VVARIGQRRSAALVHRISDITKASRMPALPGRAAARRRGATNRERCPRNGVSSTLPPPFQKGRPSAVFPKPRLLAWRTDASTTRRRAFGPDASSPRLTLLRASTSHPHKDGLTAGVSQRAPAGGAATTGGFAPSPPASPCTITPARRCRRRKDPGPESGPVDGVHLRLSCG
jgi:hypothetical protein